MAALALVVLLVVVVRKVVERLLTVREHLLQPGGTSREHVGISFKARYSAYRV
jgi:hypothetical protein